MYGFSFDAKTFDLGWPWKVKLLFFMIKLKEIFTILNWDVLEIFIDTPNLRLLHVSSLHRCLYAMYVWRKMVQPLFHNCCRHWWFCASNCPKTQFPWKQSKISTQFVCNTYRKSYLSFHLVARPSTLDDLPQDINITRADWTQDETKERKR